MDSPPDYELIDFGSGRKLESLSGYVIDRPSPAAVQGIQAQPHLWQNADAKFDEQRHHWVFSRPWPHRLSIQGAGFRLALRPTPFGHIGAFPEQRQNWQWLAETAATLRSKGSGNDASLGPLQSLNLFAHTGGSTLALAAAGAEVVHVDAAKPNVSAAREAAQASGLERARIRYIVEDATEFAARELRRRRSYDLVVLDPPAYGHSPGNKTWRIQRDLWPLIDILCQLLNKRLGALLVTGHTEGVNQHSITDYLTQHTSLSDITNRMRLQSGRSYLEDRSGRRLDAGFYVRADW